MNDASSLRGDAAPLGSPASFPEKAWPALASTGGVILVTCAFQVLDSYGPSSRIVFYDYLPFQSAFDFVLAAALGAWLGSRRFGALRPGRHYSAIRLVVGCLLGGALGLILGSVLVFGTLRVIGIPPSVLLVIAAFIPALGAWWCGIAMFRSTQPPKHGWLGWFRLVIPAAVALWLVYPQLKAFPENGTVAERAAWVRVNVRQYTPLTRTVEGIPQIQGSVGRVTAIAPASGQRQVTALTMDVGFAFDSVT